MAFLTKIAELEDHRAKLEDGKPCPLCGATEHPFAEGNVPVPDETEQKIKALTKLISKAEDQEAAIKKLEEAEVTARKNLTEGEKQETAAANDKKAAEKSFAEVKEGLENSVLILPHAGRPSLPNSCCLASRKSPRCKFHHCLSHSEHG